MTPEQQAQTFQAAYHARLSKEIGDAHMERLAQEVRAGMAETQLAQMLASCTALGNTIAKQAAELLELRPPADREEDEPIHPDRMQGGDIRKPRPRDEDLRAPHDHPDAAHKVAQPKPRTRRK